MRRSLPILLAFSLLFLSWYQLAHELTAHSGQASASCEVCLFTGHIGHGAAPASLTVAAPAITACYLTPAYTSPTLVQPFLAAQSKRGPPLSSFT